MRVPHLDRALTRTRARLSDALVDEVVRGRLEPRRAPAAVAGAAIALLVHALAATLIGGGVAMALLTFPNPATLLGLLAFGYGVLLIPLPPRLPDDDRVELARQDAPALYALLDEIGAGLGVTAPERVLLDARLNAFWARIGWRRRRVLGLGLPLWSALNDSERVALLAHELGHDRNRDLQRGFLVGNAVTGLWRWLVLMEPTAAAGISEPWLQSLANGLARVIALPVRGLFFLEVRLLMRESQRAEFLADALAARVAGTDAALGLIAKLKAMSAPVAAVRKRALAVEAQASLPGDAIDDVINAFAALDAEALARRDSSEARSPWTLASTHPRDRDRTRALEGGPRHAAVVTLDPEQVRDIAAELEAHRPRIASWMLETARGDLYYGRPQYG